MAWPSPNTRAWVRTIEHEHQLTTRIEDHDNGHVVIAAPYLPDGSLSPDPKPGTELFLGWIGEQAMTEVPLTVTSSTRDQLRLWKCKAIGPTQQVQRRSFVRVQTDFSVRMFFKGVGEATTVKVQDLSEGGLRAILDRWIVKPESSTFDVELILPSGKMILSAVIAWWGDRDSELNREVGIRFLNLEQKEADLIRRHVFKLEIENRRQVS